MEKDIFIGGQVHHLGEYLKVFSSCLLWTVELPNYQEQLKNELVVGTYLQRECVCEAPPVCEAPLVPSPGPILHNEKVECEVHASCDA